MTSPDHEEAVFMAKPSASGTLGEYYQQRAEEYDEVYRKPERQSDLAELKRLLPPLVTGRHVLEIAAGTGYWTQVLAPAAATSTATDLNAETLAVAARRDYAGRAPRLLTGDAYRLDAIPGEFDLCSADSGGPTSGAPTWPGSWPASAARPHRVPGWSSSTTGTCRAAITPSPGPARTATPISCAGCRTVASTRC